MSCVLRILLNKVLSLVVAVSIATVFISCVPASGPNNRIIDKEKALESYITLGMAYLKQGDRDASRRNFEKALDLNSNSARARNGMGLLHQLTGEAALAEKSYRQALAKDSGYTEARVNYGTFLYQQQRFTESYQTFERAAKDLSYGRRSLALSYVGQAALKLGNLERAKSAFEHSLNLNSRLPLPLLELAHISFDDEDYVSAKRYLDQYSSVAKASAKSLWLGIRIERIFGNKDKESSYALALKNLHPYSKEYLQYKNLVDKIGAK